MNHCTEAELIAWQMGETPGAAVQAHLERCERCLAEAEAISETLRVFSAEPVPQPNLHHAWQRLRGSLPVLASGGSQRQRWKPWVWALPALAACGLLALLVSHHPAAGRPVAGGVVLRGTGPISAEPEDAGAEEHLARAERLLTEVSHAGGELSSSTRQEAHELLLHNALYIQKAQERGDTPEAAVLENLGRTLTTLDHEPAGTGKGWHLRLEMNTDGLLLDVRILQQNDRMDGSAGSGPDRSAATGKDSQ